MLSASGSAGCGPDCATCCFSSVRGQRAQRIFAEKLRGPQSFRLCRSFGEMSMQAVADLLQVDRRTVQRWESEESPVPPWAMLLVAKMADERSKGRAGSRGAERRSGRVGPCRAVGR